LILDAAKRRLDVVASNGRSEKLVAWQPYLYRVCEQMLRQQ